MTNVEEKGSSDESLDIDNMSLEFFDKPWHYFISYDKYLEVK